MVSKELADLFSFITYFFIHFTPAHPRHQIHADAERMEKAQTQSSWREWGLEHAGLDLNSPGKQGPSLRPSVMANCHFKRPAMPTPGDSCPSLAILTLTVLSWCVPLSPASLLSLSPLLFLPTPPL